MPLPFVVLQFYGPSEYDEQVEEFKNTLRDSVKQEMKDELKSLRESNAKMSERLRDLDKLTREAEAAKATYTRDLEAARKTARAEVQKESAANLLAVLATPKYRVTYKTEFPPKCDKCNEQRQIEFKSPNGRELTESCPCRNGAYKRYETEEMVAWTAAHRQGKLMLWHIPKRRMSDDDFGWGNVVLKNPEGVPLQDRVDSYSDFGYDTQEAAQEVADALNAKPVELENDEW